jgi:hypothetical protein
VPVEIFVRDNDGDNVYYTAAVNEGIKKYLGQPCKYILVLNQDMYLERAAVETMAAFMDSHPNCGIGAPLQLHSGNPDYVIFAGGCEAFPLGKHQHGPLQEFTEDREILWANGACMILRKEMIREIGVGKLCEPNVELLKIKDMIYFGHKWLTGELYRNLSHKGANLTPEWVSQAMNDLRKAQRELEQICGDVVMAGHR